ncbi:MAG: leucine-rich repeat domain-containing protein [Bacteroidetes bacterium]|nr:leucine-rich repeat domain-containing protein [Bacteroidota bacterium]
METFKIKLICIIIMLFIAFQSIGQVRKTVKKLYHPRPDPKTIKRALKQPLKAINISGFYSDSVFPNAQLLKLKNVENIKLTGYWPRYKDIRKARNVKVFVKDSIVIFPKIRIDTVALRQLDHLKYLRFDGFDFDDFPKGLCVLKKLKALSISLCSIDTIPSEIENMTNLEVLDLRCNNIKSLPEEIIKLDSLKILDLTNNLFTKIPSVLLSMHKLEEINLANIEFGHEDTIAINWPFVLHVNKINYFQETETFINLLHLKELKAVLIYLQNREDKEKLKSIIRDKKLLRKIGWQLMQQ